MIEKHYLAVGFGAESGRGILGTSSTGHLDLSEMHMLTTGSVILPTRYHVEKVEINKTDTSLIWDFIRFWQEIKECVTNSSKHAD